MANTTASTKSTRCMLLEIAPELRNRIYEEVFEQNNESKITIDKEYQLPAILKTNKQIHYEAIQVYYASTAFHVDNHKNLVYPFPAKWAHRFTHPSTLWLKHLPSKYRVLIRSIRAVKPDFQRYYEGVLDYFDGEPATEAGMDMYGCPRSLDWIARDIMWYVEGTFKAEQMELMWIEPGMMSWGWKRLSEIEEIRKTAEWKRRAALSPVI